MRHWWMIMVLGWGAALGAAVIAEEDFSILVDSVYTGKVMHYPSYGKFNPAEGQVDLVVEVGFDPAANDRHQTLWGVKLGNSTLQLYFNAGERGLVFYHYNPENPANAAKDGYAFLFGTGDLNWKKGERHAIGVEWRPDGERTILVDGIPRARTTGEALFVSYDPSAVADAEQLVGDGNFRFERFRSADRADRPETVTAAKPAIAPEAVDFAAAPGIVRNASGDWQLTGTRAIALIDGTSGRWRGWFERRSRRDLLQAEGAVLLNGVEPAGTPEIRMEADVLSCRYPDGNTVRYQVEPEAIVWSIDLAQAQPVDDTLTFRFPALSAATPNAFVPHYVGEIDLVRQPTLQAIYGEPGHLAFPLVTAFNRPENLGWSMLAPLDLDRKVFFEFNALTANSFQAVMRVTPYSEAQTHYSWKLVLHDGDYRPGLGLVWADNPEAFRDAVPLMGFSQIGGDTASIPELAGYGLRYRVVNTDSLCGGYGLWVPEPRDAGYEERAEAIRAQLRELHRCGVAGLLYAQGFETKFADAARTDFADSILRTPDGEPVNTPFGIAMNPRRGGTFHRHILRQIELMLEEFPDADGFFWDWSGENRQKELIEDVAALLHARGKYLVGNNAYGRTWRFMDNVLAECSTRNLRALQYLGLTYPITYLPVYYGDLPVAPGNEIAAAGEVKWAENDFKTCLATGNFLMFQYRFPYHGDSLALFRRYLPLWEAIRERRWVFDANPLQLPEGYEGNIFALPEGGYAVTLASSTRSSFDPAGPGPCRVIVRVPDLAAYRTLRVLTADPEPIDVVWQDGVATLSAFPSAAVIVLQQ